MIIIKYNFFKLKMLLIEKEKLKKNEILDLVKKKKIAHRLLEKKEFLRFSFPKKNQGIVAIISSYNYFSFPMLLSLLSKKKKNLFVILNKIEDQKNFKKI